MAEASIKRHRRVNWQNDMLVDERHFRQEQEYFEALVGWGLQRAWGAFGLVRPEPGEPACKARVEKASSGDNTVRVTVAQCVAITPGGTRVYVRDGDTAIPMLATDYRMDQVEGRYDVFIQTDPSADPTPAGELGGVPLGTPKWSLKIERHREGLQPTADQLKVAEFIQQRNGDVRLDEFFIPPCTGILCSKSLQSKAETMLAKFHLIMEKALVIGTTELSTQAKAAGKMNEQDANVFNYLCEKVAIWLGGSIDELEFAIRQDRPPATLFLFAKKFFRLFDTILGVQGERGRSSLYETWKTWNSQFQSYNEFNDQLRGVLNAEYDHQAFSVFLNSVLQLLEPFSSTLERVQELIRTEPAAPEPAPKPRLKVKRKDGKTVNY